MDWQTILYFSSILLTCILTGFLAWYAWRQPHVTGARSYAYMALAESLLALTEIGVMLAGTEPQAAFWFSLRVPFAAITPVFWLLFALEYCGRGDWLSKLLRTALFAIPITTQVVMLTSSLHGLWLVQDVAFEKIGSFWIADTSARIPSLWYLVHTFYSTLLLVVGAGVLVMAAWRKPKRLLGQALLVSLGALTSLGVALVAVFNLLPELRFNPFVPGIGFSAVCYALAIFRFQFLKRPLPAESGSRLTDLKPEEKGSLAVLVLIFILFVTGLAASSYLTYQNYQNHFRAQVDSQLESIASLKADELQNWHNERLADASLFYRNKNFSERVRNYLENPQDAETQARLLNWMEKITVFPGYDRVFLLDTEGVEQFSIPAAPDPDAVPAALIEQAAECLASDEIIFLDFHRHSDAGPVHLSLLVPIYAPHDNQPLGVLVLRIDPNVYLYPLLQRWPVPSESAETLLLRREGQEVVFLNALRFQPDAALELRFPLTETEIPAIKAALGETGVVEGLDYRDVEVIADIRPVLDSPWFLISKMDAAEVYAPLRERLRQTLIFFGALILASGAGLMLVWRQQRVRFYRAQVEATEVLRASEERFRLAFDTSPDSVAITRMVDGKLVSVNKGFEQITGYTREESLGNTTVGLSLWKYPEDRQKVVGELMAGRKVENFESTFNTRNGEITGLMSAALIELDGELHVLNIVRDITERKQAEEKLRESEQRLQFVLQGSQLGYWDWNLETNEVKRNERWAEMLGYHLSDIEFTVNQGIDFIHADDQAMAQQSIQDHLEGRTPAHRLEYRMRTKDGQYKWILDQAQVVKWDSNQRPIRMSGTHTDITERKQAEETLRERESLLNKIFDILPVGLWLADKNGNLTRSNQKGREIWGAEPLVGQEQYGVFKARRLPSGEELAPDDWALAHTIREGVTITDELLEIEAFDGKKKNILNYTAPVLNQVGGMDGAVIVNLDITDRMRAEDALRTAEENYRSIFENALEGIFQSLPEGRFIKANPAFARMLGYASPQELIETITDIASQTYFDLPRRAEFMRVMEEQGSVTGFEFQMKRKDGRVIWVNESARAVRDGAGSLLYYEGSAEDITERKSMEKILRESEEITRLAYEAAQLGTWKQDAATQAFRFDKHAQRHFDLDESQPSLETLASRIHPEDVVRFREKMKETGNPSFGDRLFLEYRVLHRDGSIHWLAIHARTHFEEGKGERRSAFMTGTSQDITERKQAEERLQRAHEFLEGVQDSLSAHIAILDQEGTIVQVNLAWRSFSYYNGLVHSNYCIGQNYLEVCDSAVGPGSEEAAVAANAIRKVINGEESETWFEYSCHSPKEHRWFIARITSFENGGRKWVVVSHENITMRRKAEEGLIQRIAELELLHENSMAFAQSLNPKEIAQKVIQLLGEKLDWHHTAIRLINPHDNSLELAACDEPGLAGKNGEGVRAHLSNFVTHVGEGLSGWALQESKPLRIGDVTGNPHYLATYPGIHSGMYVPLKSGDHILGVISIESEKPNAFTETDELFIVTLANQAAISLENARLYRETHLHAEELEQHVRERTAEIEATGQRLELAVKTAGLGIWEWNAESGEEVWDDRTFMLHGISREKGHPITDAWRQSVHPGDLPQLEKQWEQTLKENKPYNPEYRVVLPDGNIRHIKTTAVVIRDTQGEPVQVLGADQDITLHKQAEEVLLQANAEMQRSLRMKTEFLATMSHELRTPLNSILGISESLEEQIAGDLNEKQLKYIRIINESGRHLLALINDILDLSKVEAGKLDLVIETVSVEKICSASLRMIKELAQKKSLNVSFKMDEKAKFISGDERRLKQILVNLLSNAVKFTPAGREIGLEVKIIAETREIRFTVWDQGIGIADEDKKNLFKPFVQLKSGLAREYTGSGLGLALVAQMVRLHGGHITLKSKSNYGSRFTVILPWSPPTTGRLLAIDSAMPAEVPQDISGGTNILIVDDTEVVAQLISEYLQHRGYRTRTASNGREGVLKARQEHPQIILMDVMMPEMNGFEATRELRADPATKDITIIGLTALAMATDREQCIEAGMNDHISKPVQMQELIKVIEHYLQQKG